jgi:hypothetical protein
MAEQNTTTYQLTVDSADFRWSGEAAIPSYRRLSDYLNDTRLVALVVSHVATAAWENDSLRELQKIETIALLKRNILMIIPTSDLPPPPPDSLDRIQKRRFRVTIHLPSFILAGELNILPTADWLHVMTAANEDFFPVTKAIISRTKTRAQLATSPKLVLVNRQAVIGLEPGE